MTMFWGECNVCLQRWPLGSPSECTCPQESNWQGLTDEERDRFRQLGFVGVEIVEAALKERNS